MTRLNELAHLPQDEAGPTFKEPWEAQGLAIVVKLFRGRPLHLEGVGGHFGPRDQGGPRRRRSRSRRYLLPPLAGGIGTDRGGEGACERGRACLAKGSLGRGRRSNALRRADRIEEREGASHEPASFRATGIAAGSPWDFRDRGPSGGGDRRPFRRLSPVRGGVRPFGPLARRGARTRATPSPSPVTRSPAMLVRVITAAMLAGLIAGTLVSVLQFQFVQPAHPRGRDPRACRP